MSVNTEKQASCKYINKEDAHRLLNDIVGYPVTDEDKDKHNFISMLINLGHGKERAEEIYEVMKGMIDLYNVPISAILADAIRQVNTGEVKNSQNELMNIEIKCLELMVGLFQNITNNIKVKLDSKTDEALQEENV